MATATTKKQTTKKARKAKKKADEILVAEVLEDIAATGEVPWAKPWNADTSFPVSLGTRKDYKGYNVIHLAFAAQRYGYGSGLWGTWRQIKKMGGTIEDWDRAEKERRSISYWNWFDTKDKATGKDKKIPFLKLSTVYNIDLVTWPEDLKAELYPAKKEALDFNPIEAAEAIVNVYLGEGSYRPPYVRHGGSQAYFRPSDNAIQLPNKEDFKSAEAYYGTKFHEMVHSTGIPAKLDRPSLSKLAGFGSHDYSREELVAEIGSAMLASKAGFGEALIEQSAAYVNGWKKKLDDDPKALVFAGGQAVKAVALIERGGHKA